MPGERTAAEVADGATFVPGDVADDQAVARIFSSVRESHGRLDVSVHNAGIMDPSDEGVVETPLEVHCPGFIGHGERRLSHLIGRQ